MPGNEPKNINRAKNHARAIISWSKVNGTKFELIAAKMSAMDVYQLNLLHYFSHHSPTTAVKLSYIGHELQPINSHGVKNLLAGISGHQ